MCRFLWLILILAISGCSGNQQKLEACMAEASDKFQFMRNNMGEQLGCGTATKNAAPDASPFCATYVLDLTIRRIEDEDRCVKLYK